jgi:hypothetical protein
VSARTATARAWTALVALGAAATLALATAACGSGGDSDDGPIDGAAHGTGDPADGDADDEDGDDPAASTPNPADGAPEFDFPEDVEILVDEDTTGDETVDEILRDHAYALLAMRESYAHAEPSENFYRYFTGSAVTKYETELAQYQEDGKVITGTDRFYNRVVRSHDEAEAMVTFCEDQSRAYEKDAATGEFEESEPTLSSYVSYTTFLDKGEDGEWQIKDFSALRESEPCRDAA